MNKTELFARIAAETSLSRADAEDAVTAVSCSAMRAAMHDFRSEPSSSREATRDK